MAKRYYKSESDYKKEQEIDMMNAATRQQRQAYQEASNPVDDGFVRPDGLQQLAANNNKYNVDFGSDAGGQAYYQPVDFGSNVMTRDQFAQPQRQSQQGSVSPEVFQPLDDLENIQGKTNEYYEGVAGLNSLASDAASLNFDITKPDIMDPDQRLMHQKYIHELSKVRNLGNRLKEGYEATKLAASNPNNYYAGRNNENAGITDTTQFDDLVGSEVKEIEEFNKIAPVSYDDANAEAQQEAEHKAMVDNMQRRADALEGQGRSAEAAKIRSFIPTIENSKYDASKDKDRSLGWAKHGLNKDKFARAKRKDDIKTKSGLFWTQSISRVFTDPAAFKESEDGRILNEDFAGLKWANGGTITSVEAVKGTQIPSDAMKRRVAVLVERSKWLKEFNRNNPGATTEQVSAASKAENERRSSGSSSHKNIDFSKKLSEEDQKLIDDFTTYSGSPRVIINYVDKDGNKKSDIQSNEIGTLAVLSENNPKSINMEDINYVMHENRLVKAGMGLDYAKLHGSESQDRIKEINLAMRLEDASMSMDRWAMVDILGGADMTEYYGGFAGLFTSDPGGRKTMNVDASQNPNIDGKFLSVIPSTSDGFYRVFVGDSEDIRKNEEVMRDISKDDLYKYMNDNKVVEYLPKNAKNRAKTEALKASHESKQREESLHGYTGITQSRTGRNIDSDISAGDAPEMKHLFKRK